MKKLIFSMAVITATIFASCSKDSAVTAGSIPTPDTTDGNVVTLSLTDDSASQLSATRAATATATDWEKSLSSLTIFAFDSSDNLLVRRSLNSTELSSKEVSFALPKSTKGTECSFYAVANYDILSISTKGELLELIENYPLIYNGTYAEVTSKALRTNGFVMSGSTKKLVGTSDAATAISITIKRTVAKISLELTKGATFTASYPTASLTFMSAKISKAASQVPLFAGEKLTESMTYSHTQSNATPNYLFYIYENGDLTEGNRVLLEVTTMFDADGSATTTNDQAEVVYSIELTGDGAGGITRNGLYNVVATINGLVGQDCNVTISVSNWETPVTQSVNLGM